MISLKSNSISERLLIIDSDGVKIKLNNNKKEEFNAQYFDPIANQN